MEKFKFLAMCMLVIATYAGFTACGDDEGEDTNSLTGEWTALDEDGEPELYLILNPDGTGSYRDISSSTFVEGEWTATDCRITVFNDYDDESIYYRFKGSKLYLYHARSDYDRDDYDYIAVKTGNGGSGNTGESKLDICNTWTMSGYIPDEGYVTSSLTFMKNGKCIISETNKDYPEDSYTVTVSYSLSGDLRNGATLKMWGKTVDGDNYSASYRATISQDGNTLTLVGLSGEAKGDVLELKKS